MTAHTAGEPSKRMSQNYLPRARLIKFRFGTPRPMAHHFVNDDMVYSHFVALLSAVFPPGEEGFIRSVKVYADEIVDPDLKKRVVGFVGQEAMHGREHRRLNDQLEEMGYPVWAADRFAERYAPLIERLLPKIVPLAGTAAAEHYTAVLAERLLTSPELQGLLAQSPEVRHLLNWHAMEELEHKSVAFDVYRAVGGGELRRIMVMATFMALTKPSIVVGVLISILRNDRGNFDARRILREMRGLLRGPLLNRISSDLAPYLRPGFHPDDIDNEALMRHWQVELFGEEGALVDRLS